jgi:plastocyanin
MRKFTPNLLIYGSATLVAVAMLAAPARRPAAQQSSPPAGAAMDLSVQSFEFAGPSSAAAGQRLRIVNSDVADHTVTAVGGEFDVFVAAGATAEMTTPAASGVYSFFCAIHPSMTGELTVV